jgi:hypothetical protein
MMAQGEEPEPVNLGHFQDELFRRAIRRHVQEYVAQFGDRLAAIYISGSVHRNEAVPGVSDLDVHPFITDSLRDADHAWWRQAGEAMDREFGQLYGICRPRTATEAWRQRLQVPSATRYPITVDPHDGTFRLQPTNEERQAILARSYGILLRYDATCVWGRDLLQGLAIPPPDRAWAQVALLSPWELVRFAAGITTENRTDFDFPDEPPLKLRYFAKLAIYGGASLLMARGEFRSYRTADVIPPLARGFPEWEGFLEETSGLSIRPDSAATSCLPAYLTQLVAWMDWIGAELGLERAE